MIEHSNWSNLSNRISAFKQAWKSVSRFT